MHVLEDSPLGGGPHARDARRRNRPHRAWGPRGVDPSSGELVGPEPPRLEFIAVGLDHTTAGIELRERLAFADEEIPVVLRRLTGPPNQLLDQAAILSTCNRVELYAVSQSRPDERKLASFLAHYHCLHTSELKRHLYVFRGDEVAHRLAATAAGMQSLVLGEAQIQGQVRTALQHALAAGTAGPELRRLFESALVSGRRVRSDTAIGRGVASVPRASVEFARQRLGTLDDSTVLLIGAGSMGELAAKQLVKREVGELLVLGRAEFRAKRLAERYHGRAITREELDEALALSDVVISSTGAPHRILHLDRIERALPRRSVGSRPLLLIDLAVPRDIDPAAIGLPGVELHTIDDLRAVIERALMQRRAELPDAHSILEREVARFIGWLRRREALAA